MDGVLEKICGMVAVRYDRCPDELHSYIDNVQALMAMDDPADKQKLFWNSPEYWDIKNYYCDNLCNRSYCREAEQLVH